MADGFIQVSSNPVTAGHSVLQLKLSGAELFRRHRLSHQQINDFLGGQHYDAVQKEKIRQLAQVALFMEIINSFNEAGIWFISYKGPLLSYRIYNDPTCRLFKDFDFLVKPGEVRKTIGVLEKMGFVPRSVKWPESRQKEKRFFVLLNQFTFDHPSKELSVEIHWNLLKYPAAGQKKLSAIVHENIEQIIFAGQAFYQFRAELELLHLVIHGGLHTWSRLKWLVDIHEMINRITIDRNAFEELTRQLHAERLVGLCNGMLRRCFSDSTLLPFDYPAPEWFTNYAFKQLMRASDTPVYLPEDLMTYRWFHIQAFPHLNYKMKKVFLLFVFYAQNKRRKLLRAMASGNHQSGGNECIH